ncbi:MAG: SDR family oxidoreductase [Vicinamibacterales bacterium]
MPPARYVFSGEGQAAAAAHVPPQAAPGPINGSARPQTTRAFLRGKTVLLTGGTGFLGKVVLGRLLSCAPEVARVYLLIRPRPETDGSPASAANRFEHEVVPSAAFDSLARSLGDDWPARARATLVPVAGDVSQPRLGLSDEDHAALASRVHVVINAAASVVFDEPLDSALDHNVLSVEHVATFARDCQAAALVHVSTAFVAGRRTGRFLEGPLAPNVASAEVPAIQQAVADVHRAAAAGGWDSRTLRQRLVDEGMARARRLGWHDVYSYTKSLGEMALADHRGHVPTAILRPTIIESSLRDPMPGWLENLNVGDPLWVEFGRGRMPDFPLSAGAVLDMVPVDFVANALLALLPRLAGTRDVAYYTVGSGAQNPLTGTEIHEVTYDYFVRHPMFDRRGQPIAPTRLTFPTYDEFRARYAGNGRGATTKRLLYLADLYETYMNTPCVFDTANTQALLDDLDESERAALDFDVRRIDWRSYLQDVHIPGLRRHVLGEADPARPATP